MFSSLKRFRGDSAIKSVAQHGFHGLLASLLQPLFTASPLRTVLVPPDVTPGSQNESSRPAPFGRECPSSSFLTAYFISHLKALPWKAFPERSLLSFESPFALVIPYQHLPSSSRLGTPRVPGPLLGSLCPKHTEQGPAHSRLLNKPLVFPERRLRHCYAVNCVSPHPIHRLKP